MTFLDFFAGIGTIRIGFEQAGWTCNGHVEWDKYAQQSYNAMHEIKDGEFCGWDIRAVRADDLPRSDLWTFGAPCQDFSIAGNRKGLDGERSSLVKEIFRLIRETEEDNRPTWLLYENVKGMLSSNGGWDFLGIVLEMDELGYDVEWQVLNSKDWGVPQNRERVFTLGHLRTRGRGKIFPFTRTDEPIDTEHKRLNPNMALCKLEKPYLDGNFASMIGDDVTIRDIGCEIAGTVTARYYKGLGANGDNAVIIDDQGRIKDGYKRIDFVPTLRAEVHGNQPKVIEYDRKDGIGEEIEIAHTLNSTDWRGLNRNQKQNAVVVPNEIKQIGNIDQWKRNRDNPQTGRIYDVDGISPCLTTMQGGGLEPKIAIPCLTPDRIEKRQNGRRFKEDGEPMFTLTAQDRHGVMIKEATKKGYDIAEEGDSINLEHPDSETRRGRVGKGVANTLTTSCNQGVAVLKPVRTDYEKKIRKQYESGEIEESRQNMTQLEPRDDGISNTITTVQKDNLLMVADEALRIARNMRKNSDIEVTIQANGDIRPHRTDKRKSGISEFNVSYEGNESNTVTTTHEPKVYGESTEFRIRRLTPLECWRLQGVPDHYFDKAKASGVSDSQLYKQAGNACTVNVIYEIARRLK